MLPTILLFISIIFFLAYLIVAFIKGYRLFQLKNIVCIITSLAVIISLFLYTGTQKIEADITRLIKNSGPKNAEEVYSILFKKPVDNSLEIINFKDQVIPRIDCCIWMEIKISPEELSRLATLKNYKKTIWSNTDSVHLLSSFEDRPAWFTPQVLGNTIMKLSMQFDTDNEQTLFFGTDSSHVYLCDKAL